MTGEVLWEPPLDGTSPIEKFMSWLAGTRGVEAADYRELWRWSVEELEEFWAAWCEYLDLPHDGSAEPVLPDASMPGTVWFPEVKLNYAEAMLRMPGRADDDVVVIARSQTREEIRLTAAELRDQVARARRGLKDLGIEAGDRVVAYAPNVPETLVMLLACASIGAVFASCAPEFGTQSVIDRWGQIEPKLLLTIDGYRYGDKDIDRRAEVAEIRAALPSLTSVVWLPHLNPEPVPDDVVAWSDFTAHHAELEFDRVDFATPLYLLFSSGTTGLPKPIIHGHGGITLEHLKALSLQSGLGPTDRFFWFSTTGWMMWNFLVSGIGVGATIVMFDGNPAYPDLDATWQMAADLGVTFFGTSSPFLMQGRKAGLTPARDHDLSGLRAISATGAPLPEAGFRWVYDAFDPAVHLTSVSGGTDTCSAFVAGSPTVPVWAGEISCRALGVDVDSFDDDGRPIRGALGELVIRQPMPSMPLGFWGDHDGSRYRAAYFEHYPGVWRHGDWITITERGSSIITGRSDATLNRGGVRLGTSEFYAVVGSLREITDSLVVHLEDDDPGGTGLGSLVLFVSLIDGRNLDNDLRTRITQALRSRVSPRHVPDEIHQVMAVPRTLSGKKLEVPVKKILQGTALDEAAARGALANPASLAEFSRIRTKRRSGQTSSSAI